MMGTKARIFTPVTAVSLDELVPATHFYRHLDGVVDLSFVRDLVKALGYTGSVALFRLFISSVRKQHRATGTSAELELSADGAKVSGPVDPAPNPCIKRHLSPARASWLYVSQAGKLDEKQRGQIAQIRAAHADLDLAYDLTQAFVSMLAEHRDTDLESWLAQAE